MSKAEQKSTPKRRIFASDAHKRLQVIEQRRLVRAHTAKRLEQRERAEMGQSVRAMLNKMKESDEKRGQDRRLEQQKQSRQNKTQCRGRLDKMVSIAKQRREGRIIAAEKGETLDMPGLVDLPQALQLRLAINSRWMQSTFAVCNDGVHERARQARLPPRPRAEVCRYYQLNDKEKKDMTELYEMFKPTMEIEGMQPCLLCDPVQHFKVDKARHDDEGKLKELREHCKQFHSGVPYSRCFEILNNDGKLSVEGRDQVTPEALMEGLHSLDLDHGQTLASCRVAVRELVTEQIQRDSIAEQADCVLNKVQFVTGILRQDSFLCKMLYPGGSVSASKCTLKPVITTKDVVHTDTALVFQKFTKDACRTNSVTSAEQSRQELEQSRREYRQIVSRILNVNPTIPDHRAFMALPEAERRTLCLSATGCALPANPPPQRLKQVGYFGGDAAIGYRNDVNAEIGYAFTVAKHASLTIKALGRATNFGRMHGSGAYFRRGTNPGTKFSSRSSTDVCDVALDKTTTSRMSRCLRQAVNVTLWDAAENSIVARARVGPESGSVEAGYTYAALDSDVVLKSGKTYFITQTCTRGMPDKWVDDDTSAGLADNYCATLGNGVSSAHPDSWADLCRQEKAWKEAMEAISSCCVIDNGQTMLITPGMEYEPGTSAVGESGTLDAQTLAIAENIGSDAKNLADMKRCEKFKKYFDDGMVAVNAKAKSWKCSVHMWALPDTPNQCSAEDQARAWHHSVRGRWAGIVTFKAEIRSRTKSNTRTAIQERNLDQPRVIADLDAESLADAGINEASLAVELKEICIDGEGGLDSDEHEDEDEPDLPRWFKRDPNDTLSRLPPKPWLLVAAGRPTANQQASADKEDFAVAHSKVAHLLKPYGTNNKTSVQQRCFVSAGCKSCSVTRVRGGKELRVQTRVMRGDGSGFLDIVVRLALQVGKDADDEVALAPIEATAFVHVPVEQMENKLLAEVDAARNTAEDPFEMQVLHYRSKNDDFDKHRAELMDAYGKAQSAKFQDDLQAYKQRVHALETAGAPGMNLYRFKARKEHSGRKYEGPVTAQEMLWTKRAGGASGDLGEETKGISSWREISAAERTRARRGRTEIVRKGKVRPGGCDICGDRDHVPHDCPRFSYALTPLVRAKASRAVEHGFAFTARIKRDVLNMRHLKKMAVSRPAAGEAVEWYQDHITSSADWYRVDITGKFESVVSSASEDDAEDVADDDDSDGVCCERDEEDNELRAKYHPWCTCAEANAAQAFIRLYEGDSNLLQLLPGKNKQKKRKKKKNIYPAAGPVPIEIAREKAQRAFQWLKGALKGIEDGHAAQQQADATARLKSEAEAAKQSRKANRGKASTRNGKGKNSASAAAIDGDAWDKISSGLMYDHGARALLGSRAFVDAAFCKSTESKIVDHQGCNSLWQELQELARQHLEALEAKLCPKSCEKAGNERDIDDVTYQGAIATTAALDWLDSNETMLGTAHSVWSRQDITLVPAEDDNKGTAQGASEDQDDLDKELTPVTLIRCPPDTPVPSTTADTHKQMATLQFRAEVYVDVLQLAARAMLPHLRDTIEAAIVASKRGKIGARSGAIDRRHTLVQSFCDKDGVRPRASLLFEKTHTKLLSKSQATERCGEVQGWASSGISAPRFAASPIELENAGAQLNCKAEADLGAEGQAKRAPEQLQKPKTEEEETDQTMCHTPRAAMEHDVLQQTLVFETVDELHDTFDFLCRPEYLGKPLWVYNGHHDRVQDELRIFQEHRPQLGLESIDPRIRRLRDGRCRCAAFLLTTDRLGSSLTWAQLRSGAGRHPAAELCASVRHDWDEYRAVRARSAGVHAAKIVDAAANWLCGDDSVTKHHFGLRRTSCSDEPPCAKDDEARMLCTVRLVLRGEHELEQRSAWWRAIAFAPSPLALYRSLCCRAHVHGEDMPCTCAIK